MSFPSKIVIVHSYVELQGVSFKQSYGEDIVHGFQKKAAENAWRLHSVHLHRASWHEWWSMPASAHLPVELPEESMGGMEVSIGKSRKFLW